MNVLAVAMIALAIAGSAFGQASHTHWEPYKNSSRPPSVDQKLTDPILVGAIDLHAHFGPDSYPRQWDAFEVAALAKDRGLRGVVLKNHFAETAGLAYLVRRYGAQGIEVFGAVTLDTPIGGVNPQAVRYMVDVEGSFGRIVWMPTHDSEHEVTYNKEQRPFVRVSRDGALLPEVIEVIALVAEHELTLATGHVTPEEALMILDEARKRGVTRLIVTHPLLDPQFTFMSVPQLRAAVALGGLIEITAGSLYREGPGRERVLEAVRAIGPESFFVGSDSGLVGTPNLTDSLVMAAKVLRQDGVAEHALDVMFKDNPARLLGLPPR